MIIITLLCVIFSKTLSLNGLTLPILLEWYCHHPFLFMLAISTTLTTTCNLNSQSKSEKER